MRKQKFKNYLAPLKEEREKSLKYENKKVDMKEILAKAQLQKSQKNRDVAFLSHMSSKIDLRCDSGKKKNSVVDDAPLTAESKLN